MEAQCDMQVNKDAFEDCRAFVVGLSQLQALPEAVSEGLNAGTTQWSDQCVLPS